MRGAGGFRPMKCTDGLRHVPQSAQNIRKEVN
jgi:hypothetical protein